MTIKPSDFTYARSAIEQLSARLGDKTKAVNSLYNDLKIGSTRAIGYPGQAEDALIYNLREPAKELIYVPEKFWLIASELDKAKWNWGSGVFTLHDPGSPLSGVFTHWRDVRFETTYISGVDTPRSKGGRKRSEAWENWVAAVAILAADGDIQSGMTESKLLEAISKKVISWGENEKLSRSGVQPTVQKILARFREAGI